MSDLFLLSRWGQSFRIWKRWSTLKSIVMIIGWMCSTEGSYFVLIFQVGWCAGMAMEMQCLNQHDHKPPLFGSVMFLFQSYLVWIFWNSFVSHVFLHSSLYDPLYKRLLGPCDCEDRKVFHSSHWIPFVFVHRTWVVLDLTALLAEMNIIFEIICRHRVTMDWKHVKTIQSLIRGHTYAKR